MFNYTHLLTNKRRSAAYIQDAPSNVTTICCHETNSFTNIPMGKTLLIHSDGVLRECICHRVVFKRGRVDHYELEIAGIGSVNFANGGFYSNKVYLNKAEFAAGRCISLLCDYNTREFFANVMEGFDIITGNESSVWDRKYAAVAWYWTGCMAVPQMLDITKDFYEQFSVDENGVMTFGAENHTIDFYQLRAGLYKTKEECEKNNEVQIVSFASGHKAAAVTEKKLTLTLTQSEYDKVVELLGRAK